MSPSRELVVFGPDKGTIWIWNEETREYDNEPMKRHTDPISPLSFSSDGRYLASGSEDKNVIERDVRGKNIKIDPLRGYTDSVLSVSP